MARITIDFDGLLQQANTLSTLTQSYESLNNRMNSLKNTIGTGWKGEASEAYLELMTKYHDQAAKLVEVLDAFRSYATQAAEEFESLDSQCASQIRNSF